MAPLPGYYDDTAPAQYWQVLQRQTATDAKGPAQLVGGRQELPRFLEPVCDSMIAQSPFSQAWPPWRPVVTWNSGPDI